MRKKIIIVVCKGMVLAVALLCIRLLGGANVGIDNEPEADVRGDSNVSASEIKPAQSESETAGGNMSNGNVNTMSGALPDELEYIPSEYENPSEHPGTLEKMTYQTWESFSYEERSIHGVCSGMRSITFVILCR